MTGAVPLGWIRVCSIIACLIGFWLAISCFFSFASGWHALAKRYRCTTTSSGRLHRFVSMGLGQGWGFPAVGYRRCLFARVDSAGILLAILPLFRFFHPQLFIPWSAVSDCRRERLWFINYTAVYISEPQTRMIFRGRLGEEIYEARNQAA